MNVYQVPRFLRAPPTTALGPIPGAWAADAGRKPMRRTHDTDVETLCSDHHIIRMADQNQSAVNLDLSAEERRSRDDSLRAFGLDPDIIVWTVRPSTAELRSPDGHVCASTAGSHALTDHEWGELAPFLPTEASQSNVMPVREFVDLVLNAIRRGGWSVRGHLTCDRQADAVRRRFARWAKRGVWETLSQNVERLNLSLQRKRELLAISRRAISR